MASCCFSFRGWSRILLSILKKTLLKAVLWGIANRTKQPFLLSEGLLNDETGSKSQGADCVKKDGEPAGAVLPRLGEVFFIC